MNRIELTNFRVFKEATAFDLAPITILTGKNNSGKSSLIKSFILLSDYMEPDSNQLILDLNGKQAHKHKINKFYNVKHWDAKSKDVQFQYSVDEYTYSLMFSGQSDDTFARLSEFKVHIRSLNDSLILKRNSEYVFELRVSQRFIDYVGNPRVSDSFEIDMYTSRDEAISQRNEAETELNILKKQTKNMRELSTDMTQIIIRQQELENRLKLLNKKLSVYNSEFEQRIGILYHTELSIEDEDYSIYSLSSIIRRALIKYTDNKANKNQSGADISRSIYRFYDSFSQKMSVFSYHLGPNRTYQARLYSKGSSDSEINEILTHYVLSKVKPTDPAVQFLNKWLKEFELGDELVTELYEGVATKVTIIKSGRHINIVNMGFGFGQLLTILLKITSIIADQTRTAVTKRMASPTVLIEEPEANLHPKLQSRLADMFLDASKSFQLRFILETHSEYMIRRLQLLVAYEQCALSDAVIYYLDRSTVKKLEFLPDGKLSDSFGEGFFDEADAEAMELYRIQKKKAANRP